MRTRNVVSEEKHRAHAPGIPVIPFVAADRKNYEPFYKLIEGNGGIVNDEGLAKLYANTFGDSWEKITSILPNNMVRGRHCPQQKKRKMLMRLREL